MHIPDAWLPIQSRALGAIGTGPDSNLRIPAAAHQHAVADTDLDADGRRSRGGERVKLTAVGFERVRL